MFQNTVATLRSATDAELCLLEPNLGFGADRERVLEGHRRQLLQQQQHEVERVHMTESFLKKRIGSPKEVNANVDVKQEDTQTT